VCLCVIRNLKKEEARARVGTQRQRKNKQQTSFTLNKTWSRSVGVATTLRVGRFTVRIPVAARDVFTRPAMGPTQYPI
jgi:hypothetical protein